MASHVGDCKMRLSKLLFIAMVALCLAFMPVSAQPGDEVAVENDGDAVAAGAQAVEGGAEVGESQAAQDIVRSQMATTRGPSRSQAPSKAQKGSKMKMAVIIGVIVVALAVAVLGGGYLLWWRPKQAKKKESEIFDWVKGAMPGDDFEVKLEKGDKDSYPTTYITAKKDTVDPAKQATAEQIWDKMGKVSGVTVDGENISFPYKDFKALGALTKELGTAASGDEKKDAYVAMSTILTEAIHGKVKARVGSDKIVLMGCKKGAT